MWSDLLIIAAIAAGYLIAYHQGLRHGKISAMDAVTRRDPKTGRFVGNKAS